MEDVAIVPSARPTGSVVVNESVQDANFYAQPTSNRPVEDATIFFKHALGTLSCSPADVRGKLLLTIDLDFNHGSNLVSRKWNYAFNKYSEIKLTGKRTDIIFGRSGSIGVLYTTNPWYQLSESEPGKNAIAVASDPTYRIITISDHLEMDIMKNVKDMIRSNEWYYANPGEGMPRDYYMAGRIFLLAESPPQLLDYQIPLYLVGTIRVRDYIPTEFAQLSYSRMVVSQPIAHSTLEWDAKSLEYVINSYSTQPLGAFASVGHFVPTEPKNHTITIQQKPDGEEERIGVPVATEVHAVSDFPCDVVATEDGTMFTFRTTVTKLSNFDTPELLESSIHYLEGHAIFEDDSDRKHTTYKGIPIDSIPIGAVNMPREKLIRVAGVRAISNIARVVREQQPLVAVRPAGDEVIDVTRRLQRMAG